MLVTERDAVKRTKQRSQVTSPKDHWSDGSLVQRVNSAKVVRWWRERISRHWRTSNALVLSKIVDRCSTGLPFLRSYQHLGGHGTLSHKYLLRLYHTHSHYTAWYQLMTVMTTKVVMHNFNDYCSKLRTQHRTHLWPLLFLWALVYIYL